MSPQESIAHYRIVSMLGEGGMGAVYRATDTKLNREVAIKVLPDSFAGDPDRLARFTREAHVMASLNHPNIAAIHAVEERAIVMELVHGQSPAGPLTEEEALPLIQQFVDALEYAHERGIIHRDLKPANLKVTPEGRLKVLDFGLAKALTGDAATDDPTPSPTLTMRATMAGVIMGTAAYMAPEQARGQAVDKRADIWSFGVVVYELLTGKPLFEAPTVSDTLAAVLRHDPDWNAVPARFQRLLRLCLMRDPRQRLRDISGARLLLEEAHQPPAAVRHRSVLPYVVAVAGMALAAVAWLWPRSVERPLQRFEADLGPEAVAGQRVTAAISPDGTRLVFPVRPDGSRTVQLATRLLSQSKATVLPGTEGAADPFFSPDGQWIGFFADGKMKKLSILGGAPISLADAPAARGAWWGENGMILAAPTPSDFYRVPAGGGPPLKLRNEKKFYTYRWPQVLPGGEWVLLTAHVTGADYDEANIAVLSLKTEELRIVHRGGYFGRYLPSGHLLYVRQGTIFAVPFDLKKLQLSTQPVPVIDDLAPNVEQAAGQFDVSSSGILVYMSGKASSGPTSVVWLDADGKQTPLLTVKGTISAPRISPDGKRLAYATEGDVFVYDIERGAPLRVSFTPSMANFSPVWAPDSKHLVFANSKGELWWVRADAALQPERLVTPSGGPPGSFSPDGRYLAYHRFGENSSRDIWMLPLDLSDADHPKTGAAELLVSTPGPDVDPSFSPDGKWLAYGNMESGAMNVYVRRFPSRPDAGRWQISQPSGRFALWSRTRSEIYYEAPDGRIMAVDYTTEGDAFRPGVPRVWSNKPLMPTNILRNLDLAPDGKRFVVIPLPERPADEAKRSVHVTFLLNFFDELKRRLP